MRRDLRPDLAEVASARGEQLDVQASVAALIDELARSGAVEPLAVASDLPF